MTCQRYFVNIGKKFTEFAKIHPTDCTMTVAMYSNIVILPHRRAGYLYSDDVIKHYLELAVDCDNSCSNTKFCVCQIMGDRMDSPQGTQLQAATTLREIW